VAASPGTGRRPSGKPYVHSTLVMPSHTNTLGVMHGGWMMSWMDMAAWVVAARAVAPDQTVFFKAVNDCVWSGPVRAGEVCEITARLARVGRTSLTVDLMATSEDPMAKETRDVCRATFTMVTADAEGSAASVRLHGSRRGAPASE
jgi:acyl-CoA thioesterase YciA